MSGRGRVLVTGAGRGTGYAIARAFHERGWSVAALNRTRCGEAWLGDTTWRSRAALRISVSDQAATSDDVDRASAAIIAAAAKTRP